MKWNDGKERAFFENEKAQERREYLAAGMTEEQIQGLRKFDEEWYRSRRREAMHTQRLNVTAFEEDEVDTEAQTPLLKKFLHSFSVEDKHFENDHFGWIGEIEDDKLYEVINPLSEADKEILTMLIKGFNQTWIAEQLGVSQQAISKKIKKFQIIFCKWL